MTARKSGAARGPPSADAADVADRERGALEGTRGAAAPPAAEMVEAAGAAAAAAAAAAAEKEAEGLLDGLLKGAGK